MSEEEFKFPIHPSFIDQPFEQEEETDEESGSKEGSGGITIKTPHYKKLNSGDWIIDINTLKLKNIKHNITIDLKKLNSHSRYMKLFCTIGVHPDWDIQGLIIVLNQASQVIFDDTIDHVLVESVNNEGKKIDWKTGTLSGQTVKPHKKYF